MKTKFANNWHIHNIPAEIGKYAEKLGLECLCTGGGCDFVHRKFPCGVQAILSSPEDGQCPDSLDEPSSVTVYQDEDWTVWVDYQFKDARAAMKWMKEMNPVACGTVDP